MPKVCKNTLKIISPDVAGEPYILQGGIIENGQWKRIRERSRDLVALMKRKELLETIGLANSHIQPGKRQLWTILTQEQLDDAEAAFRFGKGRSLYEAVRATEGLVSAPKNMAVGRALVTWLRFQEEEGIYVATIKNNRNRVRRFLREAGVRTVAEVTPLMVRAFVLQKGVPQNTQLSNGRPVKAFFNFCVSQGWLRQSPYEVNMKSLKERAQAVTNPKILDAATCQKLLSAACETADPAGRMGIMVPYLILSLWCFIRTNELNGNEKVPGLSPDKLRLQGGKLILYVTGHKKGTVATRKVTLPANVAPLLQECIRRGLWAKNSAPYYNLAVFNHIRVKAGLLELGERKSVNARRDYLRNDWQAHIMRHTGISFLFEKVQDIAEVCRQAGNSDDVAFKNYLQLLPAEEAEAFYKATASLPAEVTQLSGQSAA